MHPLVGRDRRSDVPIVSGDMRPEVHIPTRIVLEPVPAAFLVGKWSDVTRVRFRVHFQIGLEGERIGEVGIEPADLGELVGIVPVEDGAKGFQRSVVERRRITAREESYIRDAVGRAAVAPELHGEDQGTHFVGSEVDDQRLSLVRPRGDRDDRHRVFGVGGKTRQGQGQGLGGGEEEPAVKALDRADEGLALPDFAAVMLYVRAACRSREIDHGGVLGLDDLRLCVFRKARGLFVIRPVVGIGKTIGIAHRREENGLHHFDPGPDVKRADQDPARGVHLDDVVFARIVERAGKFVHRPAALLTDGKDRFAGHAGKIHAPFAAGPGVQPGKTPLPDRTGIVDGEVRVSREVDHLRILLEHGFKVRDSPLVLAPVNGVVGGMVLKDEDGLFARRIVRRRDFELFREPRDLRVVEARVFARRHQDKVITRDRDMPIGALIPRRRKVPGGGVGRVGIELVVAQHRLRLGSGSYKTEERGEKAVEFGLLSSVRNVSDEEHAVKRLIQGVVVAVIIGARYQILEFLILRVGGFAEMDVARDGETQDRQEIVGDLLDPERLTDGRFLDRGVTDPLSVFHEGVQVDRRVEVGVLDRVDLDRYPVAPGRRGDGITVGDDRGINDLGIVDGAGVAAHRRILIADRENEARAQVFERAHRKHEAKGGPVRFDRIRGDRLNAEILDFLPPVRFCTEGEEQYGERREDRNDQNDRRRRYPLY